VWYEIAPAAGGHDSAAKPGIHNTILLNTQSDPAADAVIAAGQIRFSAQVDF
jgi:hypothetical protein